MAYIFSAEHWILVYLSLRTYEILFQKFSLICCMCRFGWFTCRARSCDQRPYFDQPEWRPCLNQPADQSWFDQRSVVLRWSRACIHRLAWVLGLVRKKRDPSMSILDGNSEYKPLVNRMFSTVRCNLQHDREQTMCLLLARCPSSHTDRQSGRNPVRVHRMP